MTENKTGKEANGNIQEEEKSIPEKLSEVQNAAQAILEEITKIKEEAEENNLSISEINRKATEELNTNVNKLEEFENNYKQTIQEITNLKTKTKTALEKNKTDSATILTETTNLKTKIEELYATATKASGQIETLAQTATKSNSQLQELATVAEEKEEKIKEYTAFLEKMRGEYQTLNKKIESLLPGATSAGLAGSFRSRKESFKKPIFIWTTLRFISIFAFIIYGIYFYKNNPITGKLLGDSNILDIVKLWFIALINKTPIIAALVLFEEFSRITLNRLIRVEEDYAYKQIISQSFEGYKKEFIALEKDAGAKNPALETLCKNVLKVLSENPGRLIKEEKNIKKMAEEVAGEVVKSQSNP